MAFEYVRVVAPKDYPGKRYLCGRSFQVLEHHLVWWQHTGELVPDGYNLHHVNEHKKDNRFENLELLTVQQHASHHSGARGRTYVELRCPHCGTIFSRWKRQTHLSKPGQKRTFCDQSCSGRFHPLYEHTPNVIREFNSRE